MNIYSSSSMKHFFRVACILFFSAMFFVACGDTGKSDSGSGGGPSNAAKLTSFRVDNVVAVVDPTDEAKFTVEVLETIDLATTPLAVSGVQLSAGASLTTPTASELPAMSFAYPVTFTVTAADGKTIKSYTVTVSATAPNNKAELNGFKIDGIAAVVNPSDATKFTVRVPPVDVAAPTFPDLTSLDVSEPDLSAGATLNTPAPLTGVNFENPVTFMVTAADGVTTKSYTVYVIPEVSFLVPDTTALTVPGGGTTSITKVTFESIVNQISVTIADYPEKIVLTSFEVAPGTTVTMGGQPFGVGSELVISHPKVNIFKLQVEGADGRSRSYNLLIKPTPRTGIDFKIGAGQSVAPDFVQLNPITIGATETTAIEVGDAFGEITTSDDPYSLEYSVSPGATVEAKIPPSTGYVAFASGDPVSSFTEAGTKIYFKVTNQEGQIRFYYVSVKKPSTTPDLTAVTVTVAGNTIAANPLPTRTIRGSIVAPGADFSALAITVTTAASATAVTASGVSLSADATSTIFSGTVDATNEFTIKVENGSSAPKEYQIIATAKQATFLALISARTELSKFKELVDAVSDATTKNYFTNQAAITLFSPTNTVIDTYLANPTGLTAAPDATAVVNRFAELKTNQAILAEFLRSFILTPGDSGTTPRVGRKMTKANFLDANTGNTFVSLSASGNTFGKRTFVKVSSPNVFFTKSDSLSINPFNQETINGVVHIVEGQTRGGVAGNIHNVFIDSVNTTLFAIN